MKEFTLNADFGMTASDDGFALYGIHTGDMIMFKAAEDFPTNGSLVAVSIDDGPITLKRINFHGASMTCYLEGGSGKVPTIFIDDPNRLKIIFVTLRSVKQSTGSLPLKLRLNSTMKTISLLKWMLLVFWMHGQKALLNSWRYRRKGCMSNEPDFFGGPSTPYIK